MKNSLELTRSGLIISTLLLVGCSAFEPVPESYKNRLAEMPEPVITQEATTTSTPKPIVGSPSTGIQTTDVVEYVNIVTGETSYGPSIGGYLDNHPDWEQVPMHGVL